MSDNSKEAAIKQYLGHTDPTPTQPSNTLPDAAPSSTTGLSNYDPTDNAPDTASMKNILEKMYNGSSKQGSTQPIAPSSSPVGNPNITQQEKDEMKYLLEKFHSSTSQQVEDRYYNDTNNDFKKEIINEEYRESEWKITLNENVNFYGKATYDVSNAYASKSFFNEITMQQTAKNLRKILESGKSLNSTLVNDVLYYEEAYRKNYEEAMVFKQRCLDARKRKDKTKASIYETKFHNAKDKASDALKSQKALFGRI